MCVCVRVRACVRACGGLGGWVCLCVCVRVCVCEKSKEKHVGSD